MATSGGSAVATALNLRDGANVSLHNCPITVHAENKGVESTPSGPRCVRRRYRATTGYVQISDNIFMDNRNPLRKNTRVFRGFQQHVGGRRQPLAIKVICPCEERHIREVQHLVKLAPHPNVVQIIHSNKDTTKAPQMYISMELCSRQNFRDRMKKSVRFNFNEAMSFTRQLLAGMKHIHDNGIIHRDVKPENLLLSEDETLLKVSDFGLSKELEPNQSVTNISTLGQGTNAYRAPETHNSDIISKSADIFCLGITMFECFSNGKHPFGDDTTLRDHNIKNNKGHDYSGLLITGIKKEEFLDLIKWMLNKDPKKRPTINAVVQHQFFSTLSALKRTDYHQSKSSEFCIPRTAAKLPLKPQASQGLQSSSFQKLKKTPRWVSLKLVKPTSWLKNPFTLNALPTIAADCAEEGPITLAANVDGQLTVNVKALKRFLKRDELKGRPLVIITIIGAIRMGKSFIMNFFIRYLRKKGWENPNWFGEADGKMMDGFEWRGGIGPCTTGINIWSEVFDVPLDDGRKAAVMLVDTQGLYNHMTSQDTSGKIMSFSTLFSSHQILNHKIKINRKDIENLQQLCVDSVEATMSVGERGQTKPSQTLTFVVRDWYGEDGSDYGDSTHGCLQEWFGEHSESEDVQKITDPISAAFSDVKCFLLPHPGIRVYRSDKRNLQNKDLDEDFQKFTKELVETVLHPQNIVVKRNGEGDEATADDLLRMIRRLNESFGATEIR